MTGLGMGAFSPRRLTIPAPRGRGHRARCWERLLRHRVRHDQRLAFGVPSALTWPAQGPTSSLRGRKSANTTILTVDDDAAVSQAIARDLRAHYGADYRIVRTLGRRRSRSWRSWRCADAASH